MTFYFNWESASKCLNKEIIKENSYTSVPKKLQMKSQKLSNSLIPKHL